MTYLSLSYNSISEFFQIARERYEMLLLRRQGAAPPWTEDTPLARWRFCNVFREDDRTTDWFRRELRAPLSDQLGAVLRATYIFRFFNRIETGELLKDMLLNDEFCPDEARDLLAGRSPLVTGAYMIKTPAGMNKLEGVLQCVEHFLPESERLAELIKDSRKMSVAHRALTQYPYMGNFMAYQITCDLRYTTVLRDATDLLSWVAFGPGSARGLGWIEANDPSVYNYNSEADIDPMLEWVSVLLSESRRRNHWPRHFPSWEASTVQHWLCEYDKYKRAQQGQKLKRAYNPEQEKV